MFNRTSYRRISGFIPTWRLAFKVVDRLEAGSRSHDLLRRNCAAVAGPNGVFALGAGAFAVAGLVVLLLGDETAGRTLEELNS